MIPRIPKMAIMISKMHPEQIDDIQFMLEEHRKRITTPTTDKKIEE